jgi:ribosomal protein S27E
MTTLQMPESWTTIKFAPMKKSSRVGVAGKHIRCPNCGTISRIYHLCWSALQCQRCGEMIDKYRYSLETK